MNGYLREGLHTCIFIFFNWKLPGARGIQRQVKFLGLGCGHHHLQILSDVPNCADTDDASVFWQPLHHSLSD